MLSSIHIENFKAINKPGGLKLDNLAKVNYLVGKNGSGKSSVLEALIDRRSKEKNVNIAYSIDLLPRENHIVNNKDLYDKLKEDLVNNKLTILESELFGNPNLSSILSKKINDISLRDKINDAIQFLAYKTVIRSLFTTNTLQYNEYKSENDNTLNKCYLLSFETKPLTEDDELLINFLNNYFYSNDIVKHVVLERAYQSSLIITEQHQKVLLKDFASGIQNLYAFYYNLNKNLSDYENDHVQYHFYIEEPEYGLHPGLQKLIPKILNDLSKKFNNEIYFLVSTHSPFIISAAAGLADQKVYLIEDGQTRGLSKNSLGKRTTGFEKNEFISVAAKMLGAGLDDLSRPASVSEEINLIFCEGESADPDSKYYQIIFPEYRDKRNIFISCKGATEVINSYFSAKETASILFGKKTSIFAFVDRSCSGEKGIFVGESGYIKTGKDKISFSDDDVIKFKQYYKEEKISILEMKEIENYLYHPDILKKACPGDDYSTIQSVDFISNETSGEIKDRLTKLGLQNLDKIKLAETIKAMGKEESKDEANPNIYWQLYNCIFSKE